MRKCLFIVLCIAALVGCREYHVSDDPTLRLVHISFRDLPRIFHYPVREGGFTVVDMRYYAKISYIVFYGLGHFVIR